jgi:outer membrane protein
MKLLANSIVLVLMVTAGTHARDLSFDQAITLAREHSLVLKKGQADRDAYRELFRAAVAVRFPTLEATVLASYKDAVPKLEIELPIGQSFTKDFGSNETYQTDLSLQIPLYTGSKISGNIDLSRSALDLHEALLDAGDELLTLTVRVAYLSLDHADHVIAAFEAAAKRTELTGRDVQALYGAGMADSLDIYEARRAINNTQLALRSAQINRRQREIELITLLGLEPEDTLRLTSRPPEPGTLEITYSGVSSQKPDLEAAQASIAMNRSLVTLSRSDYFPTLVLFGGWSYGKPNIDPFHNKFNDYFTVGAKLNWSLNLGFKTVRNVASAKYQLIASRREYDRVVEQLDREARLALEALELAHEQYETSLQNRSIAEDNYRLAQTQHREGTLSANRLLDIEAALSQAESSLAGARTDYHITMSKYLYVIGSDRLKEGF